ncbi:MAG: DUF4918 family protein [Williamsia sp.]|nr:DUF4918 family protein [Williamsia sp.]
MNFAEQILHFIQHLQFPIALPPNVEVMNPFGDAATFDVCRQFYTKYYNDTKHRWMLIGINPGRFGGGVTGVPFTDPIRLQEACGIRNNWPKKQELSSIFMYEMMEAFGGLSFFYENFYITSVSPLGFTKDRKNLNYYDDKLLQASIKNFAVDCMHRQLRFGIHRTVAFCLGEGKNFQYLSSLNREMGFFEKIIPLAHPRFVMQYRLRYKQEYIASYLQKFQEGGV